VPRERIKLNAKEHLSALQRSGRTSSLLALAAIATERHSQHAPSHALCRREKLLSSPPLFSPSSSSALERVHLRYVSSALEVVHYFACLHTLPLPEQPCYIAIDDLSDLLSPSAPDRKHQLMRCLALAHEHARSSGAVVAISDRSFPTSLGSPELPPLASFYQRWLPATLSCTCTDASTGTFSCSAMLNGADLGIRCSYSFTHTGGLKVL